MAYVLLFFVVNPTQERYDDKDRSVRFHDREGHRVLCVSYGRRAHCFRVA